MKHKLASAALLTAVAAALVAIPQVSTITSATASPAATEDIADDVAEEVEAGPCDPTLDPMSESGCDDASSLPEIDALMAKLTPLVGKSRLAGTWIDRSVSPTVQRIALTGLTALDQLLLDGITGANPRVKAVPAQFSTATLDNLIETLTRPLSVIAPNLLSVSTDIPRNRLDIAVTNTTLANLVKGVTGPVLTSLGLPASVLNITSDWETPVVIASRNTIPPHAGGLNLSTVPINGGTGKNCTTGFTMKSDGGAIMGVTAGHCATGYLNDNVSVGGHFLSRSGMNSFLEAAPSNSDAMRYSIPSNYLGAQANYARVFTNRTGTATSPTYRKLVSPAFTLSNLQVNTRICFQGRTSGANNCGPVTKMDMPPVTYGGKTTSHMWQVKVVAAGGDSGGPAYNVIPDGRARAAGVNGATGTVDGVPTYLYISHIQYVMADVDVNMVYP